MAEYHLLRAIKNVQSLMRDIEKGWHVPLKFRAAAFTDELRAAYLEYLKRELARLERLRGGTNVPA